MISRPQPPAPRLRVRRVALACVLALAATLADGDRDAAFAQELGGDAPVAEPSAADDGKFTIHFENVELPTFVKFISKVTGEKFVYSDRVAGTVTVISPVPVTSREAVALFQSVLAVRGLTTIDDGVVTRIVPLKEARTAGGAVVGADGDRGGFATRLLPLRHVRADEIAGVLEPLVSQEGALVPYPATNTVIVTDTSANIDRVASVVSALDIPSHEESVAVVPLRHADARTMASQLAEILADPARPVPRAGAKERAAAAAVAPGRSFKIVPDERTNSVVIVAAPGDARRIEALARSLDTALQPGDQRINVYYVRYANAVDLVDVISAMLTGQRRPSPRDQARPGAQPAAAQPGVAPAIAADVTLSADPATNSVIVNASMQDYQTIRRLLESLDIERPQVFVEAIIAEVTVDRSRELGFEFQAGGDIGKGTGLVRTALSSLNPALADPTQLTGLIAAAVSDRTIELPDGTEVPAQVALFRALATDNDINVLSAPTLLTLDNQEARIVVGENVPFVTSQGVDISAVDNVFTTIERRDVGIKLTITPQVSEGDVVILQIEEEVSALVENVLLDEARVGPTTTIRVAETTVSVRDGRTAVIGGLIANSVQRRASKVPILGDIPVLGRLFRTDASGDEKVNLIVILTPHIIRNAGDLERVSEERKYGFHEGAPQVDVPFPPTGEPFVIPADPDPPSGPAYSPDEGEGEYFDYPDEGDEAPSTPRRPYGMRPDRS